MKRNLKNFSVIVLFTLMLFSFALTAQAKVDLSLTVKNTAEGVTVFAKDKECTLYKKRTDGKFRKQIKLSSVKYIDKKVVNGESYTYYIKNGNSESGKKTVVFVSAPEIVGYSVSDSGITVDWKSVEKADGYEIYRKADGGKNKKLSFTQLLSFTDITAETGKTYTYTVKAVKNGFRSGTKGNVKAVRLESPSLSSLERTADGLLLRWEKVSGAQEYIIYRKKSSAVKWKVVGKADNKTLFFEDKTAKNNQKYCYYAEAVNGKNKSFSDGKYLEEICIKAPSDFKVRQEDKKVILTWKNTAKDVKTEIFRKIGDDKWKKIAQTQKGKAEYTDKLKKSYLKVNYKIRYITKQGEGAFSQALSNLRVDPSKPMVALTYDDGPHEDYTNEILDVLEKYDARATFFVVGNRITSRNSVLKRQSEAGCEIANHSYSHTVYYSGASGADILEEINKTDKLIKKYSGQTPKLARAPGGSIGNAAVVSDKPFIQWSVDTLDWKSRNTASVVAVIKRDVRDGSIVLMHDLYGSTADATKIIVPWLIDQGYQIVTVSEMMQAKGISLEGGKIYYNGYT